MRPDQQQGNVIDTLKTRANDFSRTVASNIGFNDAIDAVAEYIAANDELIAAKFGLARARYNGDSIYVWSDGVARAEIRHAAAHARMKGEKK